MKEPIHLGNLITIDTTNKTKNITSEKILITNDYIYSKNKFCILFDAYCFFNKEINEKKTIEYSNLLKYENNIAKTIYLLLILLSPFILISVYLFYIIKYTILILFLSIILFIVFLSIKHRLGLDKIVKICLFASSGMIFLEIMNLAFKIKLYQFPLILFLFYIIIASILNSNKR